ncbi:family 9 glycosyl transferase [Calothrix sp. NIES-4071]|nr:family 9 glycosyl transferase [Calothrix sp. NIES-4071]BAZ62082.1 family 9 glycosyl transferase [Calothrix sp. NIES-4105]
MRVVALVSGGIGDQILFFPTIDTIRRHYPDAQIDVVASSTSKAAYRVSKSVSEVIAFDFQDRNSLADWGNLVGTLRDREYDVAITLEQSWGVGLVLWLTGIPTRIGFLGKGSGFLTYKIPMNTEQYLASTYHDLLKGLGINSPCPELALNVPKPDIEWAENEQKRLGVKDTGYVLISGTTNQTSLNDVYPVQNWLKIIQDWKLSQKDMPIVAVASKANEELVRILKEQQPNLKVTAPDNIGKLAAMIAGANLMVCDSSYPMHLSVAVQTFTIALLSYSGTRMLPQNDFLRVIESPTGKVGDISSKTVLEKIWG